MDANSGMSQVDDNDKHHDNQMCQVRLKASKARRCCYHQNGRSSLLSRLPIDELLSEQSPHQDNRANNYAARFKQAGCVNCIILLKKFMHGPMIVCAIIRTTST